LKLQRRLYLCLQQIVVALHQQVKASHAPYELMRNVDKIAAGESVAVLLSGMMNLPLSDSAQLSLSGFL